MSKKLGKTATYYKNNPEAKAKKDAYNAEYNKSKEQREKRAELGRINRAADKKGVDRKNKDYDHAVGRYVDSSVNRGRGKGGTAGDRRARGGGSKK